MASKAIQSNLLIKTKLSSPEGDGFNEVIDSLKKIDNLITKINKRRVTVNVSIKGATKASITDLKDLLQTQIDISKQRRAQQRREGAQRPAKPVAGGDRITGTPIPPVAGDLSGGGGPGVPFQTKTTTKLREGGEETTIKQSQLAQQGAIETITSVTRTSGEIVEFATTVTNQAAKADAKVQKDLQAARQNLIRRRGEGERFGQSLTGQGFQERRLPGGGAFTFEQPGGTRAVARIREWVKVNRDGSETVERFNEQTGRQLPASLNKATEAYRTNQAQLKLQEKLTQKLQERQTAAAQLQRETARLTGAGFVAQPAKRKQEQIVKGLPQTAITTTQEFTRTMADGSEEVVKLNDANSNIERGIRRNTQAYRDYTKAIQANNNQLEIQRRTADFVQQGFREHTRTTKEVSIGNQRFTSSLIEMRRVSGSAVLGNLALEIAKLDERTGRITTQTLTMNDAMRKMGDSFTNAVAKVGRWFAATSTIFLVARGASEAAQQFKQLEANTVFLARVGTNLRRGVGGQDLGFKERLKEAQLLTREIIEQTQVIGGNAIEAQKAASIFLRAGQSRKQALESTRAALLASRIAELDVSEAAALLSAAQQQFKLSSDQLIPTLDSLNSLSNKYKVSTDDLLQSISRAGTVFADMNSELEELAAITAIVAQRTNRTGAEIGNALKTIASRLSSPEVSGELLERTGIVMRNNAGETKNFMKIIIQLQKELDQVSGAERDRLLVTVAGARQVNILRSIMADATGAVIAHARALRDEGSALSEAGETSQTLESALLRVSASFTAMVSSGGTGLGDMLKTLVNAIDQLLILANAFDGLALKIGIFVVAVIGLRGVVLAVGRAFGIQAPLIYAAAASLTTWAGAAAVARNVGLGLVAMVNSFNVIMLVATAGIYAITYALGKYREAQVKAALAAQENLQKLENQGLAAERNRRATLTVADALEEQLSALQELNKEEAKGGKKNPNLRKELQERIGRLAGGQFGLGLTGFDQVTSNEQIESARKAARIKLAEETKTEQEKKEVALSAAQDIQANEFKKLQELQKKKLAAEKAVREGQRKSTLDVTSPVRSLAKQNLSNINKEIAETATKAEDATVKINQLKTELATIPKIKIPSPLEAESLEKQSAILKIGREATQRFEDMEGTRSLVRFDISALEVKDLSEKFNTLNKTTRDSSKALGEMHQRIPPDEWEKYQAEIIKSAEAVEKLRAALVTRELEDFTNHFKSLSEVSSGIFRSLGESKAVQQFLQNLEPLQQSTKFEGITRLQAQLNLVRADAKQAAGDMQAALDPNSKFNKGRGTTNQERLARFAALQEHAVSALNEARQLELKLVDEVLKTEEDITRQRIEQTKEARKALGVLGEEDKIRVLQQAEFLRKNPNKKFSVEEQFLASSQTNQLMQQFFGHKLEEFDPGRVFDQGFLNVGIGNQNVDLERQERQLAELFRGAGGRQQFFDQRERGAIGDIKTGAIFGGKQLPKGFDRITGETAAERARDINVNVPITAKDFQPLVDTFRDVVTVQLFDLRNEMMKEVREIWGVVRSIPGWDNKGGLPPIDTP